jgi:hypothetical protein
LSSKHQYKPETKYAVGSLTGHAVLTTAGPALGTVNVYDRKDRVVQTVRKGLGGHVEDVRTDWSFTGAVDTVQVSVGVGYGGSFTANTVYTYVKGKKTKMTVSVSHSRTAQSRETKYTYDAIGMDSRTLGWGMTFMHELLHTKVGGGYKDSDIPWQTGTVVDTMNKIRSESNEKGGDYGFRMQYQAVPIHSKAYIPFDKVSAGFVRSGFVPSTKYICF